MRYMDIIIVPVYCVVPSIFYSSLQDPNVKVIRELRAEVQRLKCVITSGGLVSTCLHMV